MDFSRHDLYPERLICRCGSLTRHKKPFCLDCVLAMPYAAKIRKLVER